MNLDDNKEFGYKAHVYHFFDDEKSDSSKQKSDDEKSTNSSKQKFQQSIFFLNRLLIDAEMRYWPIKLKVADIIWVVKKIRHMIETIIHIIIIYIDHSIAITIVK